MKKVKFAVFATVSSLLFLTSIVEAGENREVTCNVRITGSQEWMPRVELSVNDKAADMIYGTGTEGITAIDALVEACYYAVYSKDPTLEDLENKKNIIKLLLGNTTIESGWMDGIMGDATEDDYSWMFADGKTSPIVAITDYVVTEKSDLWFYYTDWMLGYRGYFDNTEYKSNRGEDVEVTLIGIPILSEMYGTYMEQPLAGIITATGNGKTYTFICNAEGKVRLENLPEGKYILSATWTDDEYGYVLVAPTATVQIGEEVTTVTEPSNVNEVTTVTEPTTYKANVKRAVIKKIRRVKGKRAKITLKKLSNVTGYQIKYSTSKTFKNSKIVRTKNISYTIKKLKKNSKYYVKARAYKIINKTRYYGKWSKVKKIKIAK